MREPTSNMNKSHITTSQAEQLVSLADCREHKISEAAFSENQDYPQALKDEVPFANNFEYLDALEKEALLILALSAIRRGKTDWTTKIRAGDRLHSILGLSGCDFNIDKIESVLARHQQINEVRRNASIRSGIKLLFPIFCHENKLGVFDQKILLLLFMKATSERVREMFSLCQFDEDMRGMQFRRLKLQQLLERHCLLHSER